MKPVSLRITGLHSFREPQTVDFAALCQAGLFGIFGPTGSGKSTILDAVTLALFGKVERAARGTLGIINHAADRVAVELVFELARGEDRRRFRVDRVYKRSGDNTVTLQAARLVEITGALEVPVAEKRAVDGEVQKLLGLGVEDFTRAVVLPQGKFDEFLKKVRPADRRAMLERLFDLEEYGDRLQKKVDRAFETAGRTQAECESELQGLGDASDEARDRAGQALAEAARLADRAVARYEDLARQQAEMTQVWTLQEELAGVRTTLAGLAVREPETARIREKLAGAERALRVMPQVAEAGEAQAALKEARERLQGLQANLPAAVEAAVRADAALREAQERRGRDEPGLQELKGRLGRAVRLEEEMAVLMVDQGARQGELDRLEEEEKAGRAHGEELAREKAAVEDELAGCLAGLARVQVDQAWRRQVQEALQALEDWEKGRGDLAKAEQEHRAKAGAAQAAGETLAAAAAAEAEESRLLLLAGQAEAAVRERGPEDEGSLEAAAVEVERLRARVAEIGELEAAREAARAALAGRRAEAAAGEDGARRAAVLLAEAEAGQEEGAARVRELEELLAGLRVRNQAWVLAQTLREGAPCPVCGSTHHPDPAVTDEAARLDEAAGELAAAHKHAVSRQKEVDGARAGEAAARAGGEALARAAAEAAAGLEELRVRVDDRRAAVPAAWAGLTASAMEQELVALEEGLNRRRAALAAWYRDGDAARSALEAARASAGQAAVKKAAAQSDENAKAAALREAAAALEAAGAELARRRLHLDAVRGGIAAESIRGEQKDIDRRDADRVRLDKKRESLETRRRSADAALAKQKEAAGALQVAISVERERLDQVSRRVDDGRRELAAICGERAAGEYLAATEKDLRALALREAAAGEAAREAAAARERTEREVLVAENAAALVAERALRSQAALQAALDREGFVTAGEARDALLPAAEQEEGQAALTAYGDELARATNRARDLESKLAGRELTGAAWQECQDGLAAAGAARDRALEEKGALGREHARIEANNVRWKQLRAAADRAAARRGKLELLRGLLRGKAFVDFLAEEQLTGMAADASQRLGRLTNYRYALEVDSEGNFIIRDDANGGVRRPVSSLSGGETFVASLALALALSLQIQLKGRYPLEFFFLDEGFGTLDAELLEVVVSTLERLHLEHLNIGVISHVPELRNRFPRQLVVYPAEASGRGTRLVLEGD